jgi:hypothetical protein
MTSMHFIGLGRHKKTIRYCVKDAPGAKLAEGTIPSIQQSLVARCAVDADHLKARLGSRFAHLLECLTSSVLDLSMASSGLATAYKGRCGIPRPFTEIASALFFIGSLNAASWPLLFWIREDGDRLRAKGERACTRLRRLRCLVPYKTIQGDDNLITSRGGDLSIVRLKQPISLPWGDI